VIVCMDAPPNRGSFNNAHIHGTHVPVEEPSTASGAEVVLAANRDVGVADTRLVRRIENGSTEPLS
jgi:hypothetical protein